MRFLVALSLLFTGPIFAGEKPTLNVYTYDSFSSEWGPGPKIEQAFEAICECDLKFVSVDSSTGILSRVQLEGDGSSADIVLGLDNSLIVDAQKTGLIAPHGIDMTPLNLPLAWNNKSFLPFDFGYFAFIYNTETNPNPPTSFMQLIEADNDLKIVIQDPRSSTPGLGLMLWMKSVYGDKAAEAWKRLQPRILTVTKGWSEAYGMFLEGEADMVLSYTTSPAYHMIVENESKYQAASFSEGHGMQIEVAAKLKNAPNPELADQFMQFILGQDFQSIIPTGNWMFPVISLDDGLPETFTKLMNPSSSLLIDAEQIVENKRDWIDEFNQALSK
ncbi:MAG: thiamine ABC transporter substrate binding subunit [Gammaproteobacteria bacterium]|nr:thiamine ABC transporter substrate binding subunit [Gammaproteobacteria bacterium]